MTSFINTVTAKANIGVCAGYNNTKEEISDFSSYLQNKLEEICKETNIYVSFIVYPTTTVYKKEWGCPSGGEKTYNIESTRNPKFSKDEWGWKKDVMFIIKLLKNELKQSTITLQFIPVEMLYMTD